MSPVLRRAGGWVLLAWMGSSAPLAGQEPDEVRVLASVDYIAGSDFYLAIGTDHGVQAGDSLPVYAGQGRDARLLGFVRVQSATARRSVTSPLGDGFSVARGDLVYLGVPRSRVAAAARRASPADTGSVASAAGRGPAPPPARALRRPRLHGRISMEVDQLRTSTTWGEDPADEVNRTFTTPTLRVHARATDLPGGLVVGTNLRVEHRASSSDLVDPATSVRVYQLELEKRFDRFPLELRLGRFYNPYDQASGYWDGALLRMGPRGLGAGVALGFEPDRWNEGISTARPKASGFVDFHLRREAADWWGAVSFQGLQAADSLPERRAVGVDHGVRLGNLRIQNRIQADQDPVEGGWTLTRMQLDGSVGLAPGLDVYVGWRRWRSLPLWEVAPVLGPERERAHAGLSFWGRRVGGTVDVGLDHPEEGASGRNISGSFHFPGFLLPGVGLGATVSRWTKGDDASLLLAPELRVDLGRVDVRCGYRLYRMEAPGSTLTSHFTDGSVTLPFGAGTFLRVGASGQWGGNLSSTRLSASWWKGF